MYILYTVSLKLPSFYILRGWDRYNYTLIYVSHRWWRRCFPQDSQQWRERGHCYPRWTQTQCCTCHTAQWTAPQQRWKQEKRKSLTIKIPFIASMPSPFVGPVWGLSVAEVDHIYLLLHSFNTLQSTVSTNKVLLLYIIQCVDSNYTRRSIIPLDNTM